MDHEEAEDPIELARRLFLEQGHPYGCAEAAFVALKTAFGLDDPGDSSAAMALNGGIAWSGGTCGAITGAALALGLLAARHEPDHAASKRIARELTGELLDAFEGSFGAADCRTLIGVDLRTPDQHAEFIDGGLWRDRCLRQILFAVARTAPLADPAGWTGAVARVEGRRPG